MSLRFPLHIYGPKQRMRDKALRVALLAIPVGAHDGWNRYDTDDTHVLHLWADGESFDITVTRIAPEPQP
jgi:hypothetical protein